MGFLAAIIVGGLAGWLAEQVMRSDMGFIMNIILGVVGALILSFVLSLFNIGVPAGAEFSWAYLLTGFVGACLLIFIARAVRR